MARSEAGRLVDDAARRLKAEDTRARRLPDPRRWLGPLMALTLACLLAEWASRRLRGAS